MLLAHDRVSFCGMESAIEYNHDVLYVRYDVRGTYSNVMVARYAEIQASMGSIY